LYAHVAGVLYQASETLYFHILAVKRKRVTNGR
jgi:hypothetical protein